MDIEQTPNLPQVIPTRCCARPVVTTWTKPDDAQVVACRCGRRIEIPLSTLISVTGWEQDAMLREIISQGFGVPWSELGGAWMFDLRGELAYPLGYLVTAIAVTKREREQERNGRKG